MYRAGMLRDGEAHAPLIVAHRGAWVERSAQNSVAALEAAVTLGCDMVELDVRRTRDRRLVAVHDARIRGTPVAALDHAQLTARLAPGQAPRLDEVLERASGRIALDLDLKEDGYCGQLMAVLARHLEPSEYVVTSFLPTALAAIRRGAPQTQTGLLLRPFHRPGLERRLLASGADFLGLHATAARAAMLAWAAERNLPGYVWTVNDARPLRALAADVRVAAVITDRPERAMALRAETQLRRAA